MQFLLFNLIYFLLVSKCHHLIVLLEKRVFQILFYSPHCEYIREPLNDLRGIFIPLNMEGRLTWECTRGPASSLAAKKLGSIFCSRLPKGSGVLGGEKGCWHLLLPQKCPEMLPHVERSNLTLPSNFSPDEYFISQALNTRKADTRCRRLQCSKESTLCL